MQAAFKKFSLHFKHPLGTSRGVLTSRDVYLISISDSNCCGIGECAPLPGLSLDDSSNFEGKVIEVCKQISSGTNPEAMALSGFPSLRFGVEMAWRDFKNGGALKFFQTEFTDCSEEIPIHGLIRMGSPDSMISQIVQKAEQGFECIKLKIGALDFNEEISFLNEFRKGYPADKFELRLDANGAFSPDEALSVIERFAKFDVQFLEQPIKPGNQDVLSIICHESSIPIALDEELLGILSFEEKYSLLNKVKPQYIILKPTLLGGISASEQWLKISDELNIRCIINSMLESNFGLNYLAQWTSTLPGDTIHGLGTGQLFERNFSTPVKLRRNALIFYPKNNVYKSINDITLS